MKRTNISGFRHSSWHMVESRNGDQPQSSTHTSVSPTNSSQTSGPSSTQSDDPSTGRESSESERSSSVSGANAANSHDDDDDGNVEDLETDLGRLIKRYVLHPGVARRVYQLLKGKVIYVAPEPISPGYNISGLSMTELLQCQQFGPNPARPGSAVSSGRLSFTLGTEIASTVASGPSALSPTPGTNLGETGTSSSNEPSRSSGNRFPGSGNVLLNGDSNLQINSGSRNTAPSSEHAKPHPLRCLRLKARNISSYSRNHQVPDVCWAWLCKVATFEVMLLRYWQTQFFLTFSGNIKRRSTWRKRRETRCNA
jgi:hypothetical protein